MKIPSDVKLQSVRKIPSRNSGCGIRSVSFKGNILTIGTGIGKLQEYLQFIPCAIVDHRSDALLGPARLQVLGVHYELQQGGHSQGRIGFGIKFYNFNSPL